MAEAGIQVVWEKSFEDDGLVEVTKEIQAMLATTNRILDHTTDLVLDGIGSELFRLYEMEPSGQKGRALEFSNRLMWTCVVDASAIALYGSATRFARLQPDQQASLPTNDWIQLAYEQRDYNLDGEEEPDFFTEMVGDDDMHLESIGFVAHAIVASDIFAAPQRGIWFDQQVIFARSDVVISTAASGAV